jgi:hypothetical protein
MQLTRVDDFIEELRSNSDNEVFKALAETLKKVKDKKVPVFIVFVPLSLSLLSLCHTLLVLGVSSQCDCLVMLWPLPSTSFSVFLGLPLLCHLFLPSLF